MRRYIRIIMLGLLSVMLFVGCNKTVKSGISEINIDYKDVKSIELYDIEGKKVSEFSQEEYSKIISYLNSSKISNDPHILMITGKIMKITFKDSSEISFNSYGSKTNCVVGGKYKGKDFNYHLVSPDIAKILLEK